MSNQTSGFGPKRSIAWQKGVQPPGTTGVPNQSSSFPKREGIQIIREIDGTPSIEDATILEVTNGTLTNPSAGVARLSIAGGGGGGGGALITLGHGAGIPGAAGVRYLRVIQDVITSDTGFRFGDSSTLVGLSLSAIAPHPTNVYRLEFLTDPSGGQGTGPTVIATLDVAATTRGNQRKDLSVAVAAGVELGARVIRLSGAGGSLPFRRLVATAEFTSP